MVHSTSCPALQEIKSNIDQQDLTKARLVIEHFTKCDKTAQEAIVSVLCEADNEFAIPILSYLALKLPEVAAEFHTLTETLHTKAMRSPDVVIAGLTGSAPETPYYLILAGELNLQQAVPTITKLLLRLDDKKDILAALSSLGTLGASEAINSITEFLYVDDFDLASAAVYALGHISTPTAIQRLAALLGKDRKLDLLILNVFANVQDDFSLHKLNEALRSHSAAIRNHARTLLTVIGVKTVPMLIANLSGNDSDHMILSLNTLQEIGDESASLAVRKLINTHPNNANVRFAAYEALADLSNRKGDYVLAGGLADPDSNVRMAAAKAIDRNLDDVLIAGIRNMIEPSDNEAANIVKAIIDAQVGNLFIGLIESESFIKKALPYLGRDVHRDVRDYFVKLLIKENSGSFADEITLLARQQKKQVKGRVCAVDDSKMILNIYRSVITELGFEAVLFSEPVEAVSWLEKEKPDFLCTDLNMPNMTGIELIHKVRKNYNKNDLPIILVTTQNEVQDNKAAWEAGVSDIMHKPFDAEMLADVFAKITE